MREEEVVICVEGECTVDSLNVSVVRMCHGDCGSDVSW
jgi:hypothetical protein